jgi:hypothetical protein
VLVGGALTEKQFKLSMWGYLWDRMRNGVRTWVVDAVIHAPLSRHNVNDGTTEDENLLAELAAKG